MKVREHTKVCDRALIPQATKQFARYDTPPLFLDQAAEADSPLIGLPGLTRIPQ